MTEQPRCPVVHFDHHSHEHAEDPVGTYRALRATAPVAWTEAHGGYWVLSDYASVFEAARDDDTFSSARNDHGGEGLSVVIPKAPTALHIPIELDPPEFRPFRKVLNQFTSPAHVATLQPTIDRYVTAFIDEVVEAGECDLASVIGVPAAITVDWLGLEPRDYQRYAVAMHTIVAAAPGSEAYVHATTVDVPWVTEQVYKHIAACRERPGEDVVSQLIQAEVDGRRMTDDEIYSMVELLLSGGVGTTASLVSQALVWMARHPDQRTRLIEDPTMLDVAVEEFLRVFSPVQALARTATQDLEFHGCPMRRGDRVLISWASANRDPDQFEEPDAVDIARWPNRHAAFGVGIHRCAGSHLARAMARTLLGQILARMPDYQVDFDALEHYPDQGTNAGWRKIPTTFTPGDRRSQPLW